MSLALFGAALPAAAEPSHGLALYGSQDLKYGPDEPFDWVGPDTPIGGVLRLPAAGSFTKLNPFSLRGVPAPVLTVLTFETLMEGSSDSDEPFSQYGLLAETADVADDRMSVTYRLREEARFSDGRPVTADDVVFSFNLIHDPGFLPFYKAYYADVDRAEKLDERTVRFVFKQTNQELPLIMGQLFILPRHVYGVEGLNFGEDFDDVIPVASGPYLVESYDHSSHITYRRNPEYWGWGLPKNKGKFNFDKIVHRMYLDPIGMREALKGGEVDAQYINGSKDWALEFNGPFVQKGYLAKEIFPHERVPGMQCFVFNLRKSIFRDREVRKVIASLFDFEHANEHAFYGQYIRTLCCWDNNPEMMSRGPAKGRVRNILVDLRKQFGEEAVPADAIRRGPFNVGYRLDGEPFDILDRIEAANRRLEKQGWHYDPALGMRRKGDLSLRMEILLTSPGWTRIVNPLLENLRQVGIRAEYRLVQPAEFLEKINDASFDIIIDTYQVSESPGNEQRNYWHSASADETGSRNTAGIRNPAVDLLVDRIIAANTRRDLVESVQALDRVLCANHYFIPQFHINYDRAVFWNRFGRPEHPPSRLQFDYNIQLWWWYDRALSEGLDLAMKDKTPFRPSASATSSDTPPRAP